jgi:hypothetical protein
MQYYLLSASSPDTLSSQINERLGRGWQLYGSPFTYQTPNGNLIAQAMIYGDLPK